MKATSNRKSNRVKNNSKSSVLIRISLIIGILAGLATIIGLFYNIFCTKDYSEDIKKAVVEIKKQHFVMEQMPDSLLEIPTVKQAREVQQKILVMKEYVENIDFATRDNEDTPTAIYRYVKEMKNFETLCNKTIEVNNLFSAFIVNNPQYSTLFNLGEYQKKTNTEMELTAKIGTDIKASLGEDKTPEKKRKLLQKALTSKEMADFLYLQKEVLLQVFDYLNKVQSEVKLNTQK